MKRIWEQFISSGCLCYFEALAPVCSLWLFFYRLNVRMIPGASLGNYVCYKLQVNQRPSFFNSFNCKRRRAAAQTQKWSAPPLQSSFLIRLSQCTLLSGCCSIFRWLKWFGSRSLCHCWLDFVCTDVTVLWLRRYERLGGSANQRKINSVYTRVLMMNNYSFLCSWKIIQLEYPIVINSLFINQLLTQCCSHP